MEEIFKLSSISKSFPGVKALDSVSLSFNKGEVHAICGENGAGKSTLIKIMCGVYEKDEGEIFYKGKKFMIKSPIEAINAGISVVHQEIKLAENISIAENIFIGRPPRYKTPVKLVNWKQLKKDAKDLLSSMNIDLDVDIEVNKLSIAQKQIVEIAKALSYNADVIIMDEPSATLTEKELATLFQLIEDLRKREITIIYISHRLEEVFRLADRVSVLRDGKYIDTLDIRRADKQELITLMVNRPIGDEYPKEVHTTDEEMLRVENLSRSGTVNNVSFSAYKGEILGFAGLVGAGRTETVRLIYGADDKTGGEIYVRGKNVTITSPQDAIKNGIALMPEDRKGQGLIMTMSVCDNYSMTAIDKFIKFGLINRSQERQSCQEYIDRIRIKTPNMKKLVGELSGGNQQKVVLARWLLKNSDILILDDPTRGVDVGAKTEIYNLLNELTKMGKTILMISSDMLELMGMSDRIIVISKGRVAGELQRSEFEQEKILSLAIS